MAGNVAIDHALGCRCFQIPRSISIPGTKRSARFSCASSLRDRLLLGSSGGGAREAFYQPFRPPPGLLESAVTPDEQLEIVRERRGRWFDYGKHIPGLMRSGYTPASLDEATGITGVEQNHIVVACQIRDTLISTGMDEAALSFFDTGGPAILYELRILSAPQRKVAAMYVVENDVHDPKLARDLAKALKDFDRRRREFGWDLFSRDPGDCLAFWWYRQSKEVKGDDRLDVVRKALGFATSKSAKGMLSGLLGESTGEEQRALEKVGGEKAKAKAQAVRVVRLEYGETAGLVMLPVAEPEVSSVKAAPLVGALGEGAFRIHRSGTAWRGWVPLPGWKPVLEAVSPVTVLFPDGRDLGLLRKRRKGGGDDDFSKELLLLVDKGRVDDRKDGSIYLVAAGAGEGLSLDYGKDVAENVEVLAEVLLALLPPGSEEQEDESHVE